MLKRYDFVGFASNCQVVFHLMVFQRGEGTKLGVPGNPSYLPNPSEWHVKNRGLVYIVNQDVIHMDIATRSLYLVVGHLKLTACKPRPSIIIMVSTLMRIRV